MDIPEGAGVSKSGGGGSTQPIHTPPPPLILTPSSSHQNTYGWQASDTHPTGMLSCFQ